uniref:Uncharacterized protein n=1 Tax=Bracon brevicornis TaxID=1563983 RepID=A0A6V7LVA3_9HYME
MLRVLLLVLSVVVSLAFVYQALLARDDDNDDDDDDNDNQSTAIELDKNQLDLEVDTNDDDESVDNLMLRMMSANRTD